MTHNLKGTPEPTSSEGNKLVVDGRQSLNSSAAVLKTKQTDFEIESKLQAKSPFFRCAKIH